MKNKSWIIVLSLAMILILFTGCASGNQNSSKADTVIYANFYTGTENTQNVEAVAIKDGVYIYTGSRDGVKEYIGDKTEVLDYSDSFGMPGMIDAHLHAYMAIEDIYFGANLAKAADKDEYQDIVLKYIEDNPGREVYIGRGWRNENFENMCPSGDQMEKLNALEIPVALSSADSHSMWANQAMMDLCGVTKDTPDVEGGTIEKDSEGNLTGCFRESAMSLIKAYIPSYTVDDYYNAIPQYQEYLASLGYTGYCEVLVSSESQNNTVLEAYEKLDAENKLILQTEIAYVYTGKESAGEFLDKIDALREKGKGGKCEITDIKIFMDGVVEGETAYLSRPYATEETYQGINRWESNESGLTEILSECYRRGYQPHIHAIGDAAVTLALDCVDAAQKQTGIHDIKTILTHLELMQDSDIARLKDLNISIAANFFWGSKLHVYTAEVAYLTEEVAQDECYLYKDMLNTGINMSAASDYPPGDVQKPLLMFQTAVTRTYKCDESTLRNASQKLTREEALKAFTYGGAVQFGKEDTMGTIEVGKNADLIILKNNLLTCSDKEIYDNNEVLLTLTDGVIRYTAG